MAGQSLVHDLHVGRMTRPGTAARPLVARARGVRLPVLPAAARRPRRPQPDRGRGRGDRPGVRPRLAYMVAGQPGSRAGHPAPAPREPRDRPRRRRRARASGTSRSAWPSRCARRYACEGASTRSDREPCGRQDGWHLHVHRVPPGPTATGSYERLPDSRLADVAERAEYAERLAAALGLPRTFGPDGTLQRRVGPGDLDDLDAALAGARGGRGRAGRGCGLRLPISEPSSGLPESIRPGMARSRSDWMHGS